MGDKIHLSGPLGPNDLSSHGSYSSLVWLRVVLHAAPATSFSPSSPAPGQAGCPRPLTSFGPPQGPKLRLSCRA
jgi:hypothetical protein